MKYRRVRFPKWATACCNAPQRDILPQGAPGKTYITVTYCKNCNRIGGSVWPPGHVTGVVRDPWRWVYE